jgi:23S rRNA (pseudouridine1915-N3)-methyltransferase
MNLSLVSITPHATSEKRSKPSDILVSLYLGRIPEIFAKVNSLAFRTPDLLWERLEKQSSRSRPLFVLLDSRGKRLTSEQFADWLGKQRDQGQQSIVFAIGPADGWSEEARKRAHLLLSLGPMTLPHELARVVLSEQIYRAFTILSGHPYHTGH